MRRMRTVDSTRTERAARGWLCTAAEREASKERTDTNGKRRETRDERGGETSESGEHERRPKEYRGSTQGGRASERKRGG